MGTEWILVTSISFDLCSDLNIRVGASSWFSMHLELVPWVGKAMILNYYPNRCCPTGKKLFLKKKQCSWKMNGYWALQVSTNVKSVLDIKCTHSASMILSSFCNWRDAIFPSTCFKWPLPRTVILLRLEGQFWPPRSQADERNREIGLSLLKRPCLGLLVTLLPIVILLKSRCSASLDLASWSNA